MVEKFLQNTTQKNIKSELILFILNSVTEVLHNFTIMSLNITSLNLLRNFSGVVLYPWEARVFTGDDIAGFAYEKTYYQVLVDNRDADELPMELETLRISEDTTRNPSDVKVSFISFNLINKLTLLYLHFNLNFTLQSTFTLIHPYYMGHIPTKFEICRCF